MPPQKKIQDMTLSNYDGVYFYKSKFSNIKRTKGKRKGQYLYSGKQSRRITSALRSDGSPVVKSSSFSISAKNIDVLKDKLKKIA